MSNVFDGHFTVHSLLNNPQINANTINFESKTESAIDKKAKLLESLKFKHIDSRWSSIKQEHFQTCAWVLDEPEFRDWLAHRNARDNNGFLWIKGHPGCGKSTLMKYAFSATRKKVKATTFTSFFFNARGDALEKSTLGMYRSLLRQILSRQSLEFISDILDTVTLDEYDSETFVWTNESLEYMFSATIKGLKRPVICFIDALDECDEEQVQHMVSSFRQLGKIALQHQTQFQVCFSSRHYPNISIRGARALILDGRAGHHQDITYYIEDTLDIGSEALAREVKAEVQRKSGGIFMWVVLVVGLLNDEYNNGQLKALRQRLDDIPEKLSTLFRQITTRHCKSPQQVLLCLQWLLFAKEPLQPGQLYCAVLIETDADIITSGQKSTDPNVIKNFILSSSKGLAEIVQSDDLSTVQFIHESVRDFLLKENGLQELWSEATVEYAAQSQDRLKNCCALYLKAFKTSVLGYDFIPRPPEAPFISEFQKSDPESYPLLQYATENILYHADKAASKQISQADFIKRYDRVTWIVIHNTFQSKKSRRYHLETRLLYILAQINASNLIDHHPEKTSYIEYGCERFGTPLFVALAAGNAEVIRYFLELHVEGLPPKHPARCYLSGHDLPDGKLSRSHWSACYSRKNDPLAQVLEFCDDTASVVFLRCASPDALHRLKRHYSIGFKRLSSLALAASEGCYETAKILLEEFRIDPTKTTLDGMSALHCAAQSGNGRLVRLLLEHDMTDVNLKNDQGHTPLMSAILRGYRNGSETTIKVLREFQAFDMQWRGQTVNASDTGGFTHIPEKSRGVPSKCRKIDFNAKDVDGASALYLAVRHCTLPVIAVLLESHQIEIDSQNNEGRTPFSLAADMYGRAGVMKILLNTGKVDIDSRDSNGRTPFSYAAGDIFCADMEKLKILLNTDKVDVNSRDNNVRTPLSYGAMSQKPEMVEILLDMCKEVVDLRDGNGRTPLSYAAQHSIEEIVKAFLETHQVDVNSRDNQGMPPLLWATADYAYGYRGAKSVMAKLKCLLEIGHADPAATDNNGRSLFWFAAACLNIIDANALEEFLALLVDINVKEVQSKRDIHGISPIQAAAYSSNLDTFRTLLDIDDIDIREGDWKPPVAELWADYPDLKDRDRQCHGERRKRNLQSIKKKWLSRQEEQMAKSNSNSNLKRLRERAFSNDGEMFELRK